MIYIREGKECMHVMVLIFMTLLDKFGYRITETQSWL